MAPLLEAQNISKQFPGVRALDQVSLHVHSAEILALVGENGAGKSTLMKILAGIYQPDGGQILLDGVAKRITGVRDALSLGISLIHQELNLAENLSVSANLFLGRELQAGGPIGLLKHGSMAAAARILLARVGLDCSPDTRVANLTPGQRQLVEIARSLGCQARILIMDEPTSSLTQGEADRLFQVIADLKKSGVAVIYISHRLGEVKRLADRAVVLRDGRNAGELARAQIDHSALVKLMVGRDLGQFFQRKHRVRPDAPTRMQAKHIRYHGGPAHDVTFDLRGGEIVGMAGLIGAGRTELAEAVFGIRRITRGHLLLDGQPCLPRRPRQAIDLGILLIPEDRRYHGLVLEQSVQENIALPNYDRLCRFGLVSSRRESSLAAKMCEQLRVKTPSPRQKVGLLSGGNQQKVVLGKWLARQPRVIIFDEPTRGIDVGAKSEIYGLMDELAGAGVAVLMISSDLEEILGMSDRVLVLHEGRLAGEVAGGKLSEQAVMHLATGGG